MPKINEASFNFVFLAHNDLEAEVVRFAVGARLNSLYTVKVLLLVSTDKLEKAQWADFFATPCELSLKTNSPAGVTETQAAQANQATWSGLLTHMTTGDQLGPYTYLEVELTPWLGLLAGQVQNRVHLDLNCLDVLRDSFKFGGLELERFRFATKHGDYPKRDFIFQYEEDLLDFVWRTLRFDGLGLYYEQAQDGEVAVIVDNNAQFPPLLSGDSELVLTSAAHSGLAPNHNAQAAYNFRVASSLPPQSLLLRDYNWEDPNRPLEVQVRVSPRGRGEVHLYGENFATEAEGVRLAHIRREEILANSELYHLTTSVPGFKPGLTFSLQGHPWGGFNDRYLTVATEFSGSQTGPLTSRLGLDLGQEDLSLEHKLVCQKLSTPYRPALSLARKKISGSLTAWIDGAGSGDFPEIDKYGRYKVLLPQDISGRGGGKASAWIRMAQPYVGKGYGQNFPLTPGAEVLLTFIDGNPDRPVISGAVPNAETSNIINSATSNLSGLGTKGGSSLLFHDKAGEQKVVLGSGSNRGSITLSAGSPTGALVQADHVSVFSLSNVAASASRHATLVGTEKAVHVDDNYFLSFAAVLQTLQNAATTSLSAYEYFTGDDVGGGHTGDVDPSTVTSKYTGMFDFGINLIAQGAEYQRLLKKMRTLPIKPHNNLIDFTANSRGCRSVMRAKRDSNLTVIGFCSFLGHIVKIFKAGVESYENAKDLDNFEKKKGSYQNADISKGANALKIASVTMAEGSELSSIIASVISDISILKAMTSPFGETKGIVIDNEDSYVEARAKTFASFAAAGPVIVESGRGLLGEVLRHDFSSGKAPTGLLQPEIATLKGPQDYNEGQAVVLLSDLVRAKAMEVSLEAFDAVVAKSAGQIQLIAGTDAAGKLEAEDHEIQRQELYLLKDNMFIPPDNDPENVIAKAVGLDRTAHYHSQELPVKAASGVEAAILLRTEGEKNNILLQTVDPTGTIELLQGKGTPVAGSDARHILLNSSSSVMQEDLNTRLELQKGSKVSLQLSSSVGLQMEPTQVALSLSPTSKIQLTEQDVEIKGPETVKLATPVSSLELNSQGFLLKVGGLSFQGTPVNLKLG
ncbi:MAG: type VI secretion system tip protein VgrG [Deltaproteobacteria bacterium]|jgi:type VI secretion system VgrG family protein|nr:type VI secretion system tip protein VgrG [Deltaproteobacteria bacterium]